MSDANLEIKKKKRVELPLSFPNVRDYRKSSQTALKSQHQHD